jgi:hypothetical protein
MAADHDTRPSKSREGAALPGSVVSNASTTRTARKRWPGRQAASSPAAGTRQFRRAKPAVTILAVIMASSWQFQQKTRPGDSS